MNRTIWRIPEYVAGPVLGLVVFLLDWFKESTGWNVPPMMVTFYLFVLCSIILVAASYFYPHHHSPESEKLVWRNPMEALETEGWRGIGNYKVLAALLFIVMVGLYMVFG